MGAGDTSARIPCYFGRFLLRSLQTIATTRPRPASASLFPPFWSGASEAIYCVGVLFGLRAIIELLDQIRWNAIEVGIHLLLELTSKFKTETLPYGGCTPSATGDRPMV
jgi:hypothetical protein